MVIIACIASSTVFGMMEVIDAATVLTESLTISDSADLAGPTDICDMFQAASCDNNLN